MNIALIGYGKMGKSIEKLAIQRGHKISVIVNSNTKKKLFSLNFYRLSFYQKNSCYEILECLQTLIH